ncbi:MAG: ammonium transporter [Lentisphaeria bacterium]|nr:ammonium transporter [Lentisphaeria bacterium]
MIKDGKTVAEEYTTAWYDASNVWMMIAAALVFIMHLGFGTLECGLTRAKNTTNILFKNVSIVAIGLLTYALIGFNLMYPGEWISNNFLGKIVPGIGSSDITTAYNTGYTYWTDFLFQGMFAATAATIISGAVAERIKLGPFLIFVTFYVAIIYPIVGSWQWGGGWLAEKGFYDFAGSTIVHGVGGWGALICAFILGPRIGKYTKGVSKALPGHNLPLATAGVFLLWLGWFGFNGGSVLSADPEATSFTLVTTCLAAAAGVMGAMATSWIIQKKPDLTMILNGALAGLVGITAGADSIPVKWAIVVGLVAGILVVAAVLVIDQVLKIDDPVGAISVHLVCGIWGTLAVGLFGGPDFSFTTQLIGVVAVGAFCIVGAGVPFYILHKTVGMRVSEEEEILGLDICEHGQEAYSGFQIFTNQ